MLGGIKGCRTMKRVEKIKRERVFILGKMEREGRGRWKGRRQISVKEK